MSDTREKAERLPELPEPAIKEGCRIGWGGSQDYLIKGYTAEQMRSYADAVSAHRVRAALGAESTGPAPELLQQALDALVDLRFVLDCALGINAVRPADADGPAVQADAAIDTIRAAIRASRSSLSASSTDGAAPSLNEQERTR